MLSQRDLSVKLNQFRGSEVLYRLCHRQGFNRKFLGCYTPGVRWLAETLTCYWLLNDILVAQDEKIGKNPLQSWSVMAQPVEADLIDMGRATVSLKGKGKDLSSDTVFEKTVSTCFPYVSLTLWVTYVKELPMLLLPNEHPLF